jgi:formamidopyrimidine-DNA glycosylase
MPELPEVEVVKDNLQKNFAEHPQILCFKFFRSDLRDPIPQKELRALEGARLLNIRRRAKYLIFETEKGEFLSHLGMTGVWRLETSDLPLPKQVHDHVEIDFANGSRLIYNDPRRFGVLDIVNAKTLRKRFSHLGPEPLDPGFTGQSLWRSLRGRNTTIKVSIMDQKFVVGVGNIYASEALFLAGIRPQTKAHRLSLELCEVLVQKIRQVLRKAIQAGGSTISDFAHTNGRSGDFQNHFKVYGRNGKKCLICGAKIKSEVLGGRSTFWCPGCQPALARLR